MTPPLLLVALNTAPAGEIPDLATMALVSVVLSVASVLIRPTARKAEAPREVPPPPATAVLHPRTNP